MDPRRFDSLTRSLAAPKTRRGLLGALAASGPASSAPARRTPRSPRPSAATSSAPPTPASARTAASAAFGATATPAAAAGKLHRHGRYADHHASTDHDLGADDHHATMQASRRRLRRRLAVLQRTMQPPQLGMPPDADHDHHDASGVLPDRNRLPPGQGRLLLPGRRLRTGPDRLFLPDPADHDHDHHAAPQPGRLHGGGYPLYGRRLTRHLQRVDRLRLFPDTVRGDRLRFGVVSPSLPHAPTTPNAVAWLDPARCASTAAAP